MLNYSFFSMIYVALSPTNINSVPWSEMARSLVKQNKCMVGICNGKSISLQGLIWFRDCYLWRKDLLLLLLSGWQWNIYIYIYIYIHGSDHVVFPKMKLEIMSQDSRL
jgi:hypothetical protein